MLVVSSLMLSQLLSVMGHLLDRNSINRLTFALLLQCTLNADKCCTWQNLNLVDLTGKCNLVALNQNRGAKYAPHALTDPHPIKFFGYKLPVLDDIAWTASPSFVQFSECTSSHQQCYNVIVLLSS